MSELHPATKLLLARLESHPEEFTDYHDLRWHSLMEEFRAFAGEEDIAALNQTLNRICMDRLHEKIMDELLNGEERRAEEVRLAQEKAKNYAQISAVQKAQVQQFAGVPGTAIQHPADHWGNVANTPRPSLFRNVLGKLTT